jgi:hypothetical protein
MDAPARLIDGIEIAAQKPVLRYLYLEQTSTSVCPVTALQPTKVVYSQYSQRQAPIGFRITLVRLHDGQAASYEVFAEGTPACFVSAVSACFDRRFPVPWQPA